MAIVVWCRANICECRDYRSRVSLRLDLSPGAEPLPLHLSHRDQYGAVCMIERGMKKDRKKRQRLTNRTDTKSVR